MKGPGDREDGDTVCPVGMRDLFRPSLKSQGVVDSVVGLDHNQNTVWLGNDVTSPCQLFGKQIFDRVNGRISFLTSKR